MSSGHERSLSRGHAEKVEQVERHLIRVGYAPGTVEQRVARLRALPKDPSDCTTADVLVSLPGDAKPSTKRVYLGALRAAYRDLITLGLVERDPTIGIRIPGVGRKVPRPLTDDQVQVLLAERGRERDWTALGCYAGLRASDVVSLYAEDLVRPVSPRYGTKGADRTRSAPFAVRGGFCIRSGLRVLLSDCRSQNCRPHCLQPRRVRGCCASRASSLASAHQRGHHADIHRRGAREALPGGCGSVTQDDPPAALYRTAGGSCVMRSRGTPRTTRSGPARRMRPPR